MAESEHHIILVRILYNWVIENLFGGDSGVIYVDLPEISKHGKPPNLSSGVKPDLYAKRALDKLLVIGEAKTGNDLERTHSLMQYKSYIDECERHEGPAIIIMAVPWSQTRTISNILKSLLKKAKAKKTQFKALEKLPG